MVLTQIIISHVHIDSLTLMYPQEINIWLVLHICYHGRFFDSIVDVDQLIENMHSPIYKINIFLFFLSTLDQYIGECMVSLIKINNDIEEPTRGYQIYNTRHILIFGGYIKVRESMYTRHIIIWGQYHSKPY